MAYNFDSEKSVPGGKHCFAVGLNLVHFTNDSHTEGISMHKFPKEETDPQRQRKWIYFVRKNRPQWSPTSNSFLCSVQWKILALM